MNIKRLFKFYYFLILALFTFDDLSYNKVNIRSIFTCEMMNDFYFEF